LIPVIDVEWYGDMKRNPPEKEIVLQQVKEMTALMENEYGCKPLIYTTQSFYKKYFEGESLDNPLWIRKILFEPSQDFVIWQYTERFRIENATDEYIDGDVTDEERFERLLY
jgi:lysozyme